MAPGWGWKRRLFGVTHPQTLEDLRTLGLGERRTWGERLVTPYKTQTHDWGWTEETVWTPVLGRRPIRSSRAWKLQDPLWPEGDL